MSSAISRNLLKFKKVAHQILRIDVKILKRNQLNEDNRLAAASDVFFVQYAIVTEIESTSACIHDAYQRHTVAINNILNALELLFQMSNEPQIVTPIFKNKKFGTQTLPEILNVW